MKEYGFIRVGAASPSLKVGDTKYNIDAIKEVLRKSKREKIDILTFPELSITSYTCGDLFNQELLLKESLNSLKELLDYSKNIDITFIVGMPLRIDSMLFNTAVVINKGIVLGIVPKTYIPNYNEFYELRWFNSSKDLLSKKIKLFDMDIPIGTNIIFNDVNTEVRFAIEICEDLWCVNSPSNDHSLNGANIIFNLSSSNEIVGKYEYRKDLVKIQSSKTISAYIYVSSGVNESTSDILFSGSSMIYENGSLLKENDRFTFEGNLIYADVDVLKLNNDRMKNKSFMQVNQVNDYVNVYYESKSQKQELTRKYSKTPFFPQNDKNRLERCNEIFNIQSYALAKRLKHTEINKCIIGMSGGLDSTLAFLVIVKAFEILNIDNKNIICVTMPGFGTTNRTYKNACDLVNSYNATLKEVSIKEACIRHFKDINHDMNDHDITYENSQARERTQILFDIANKENGLVIGTGDLSELALGWCTYNGDHMSNYAVNVSIPKTLVKYLVKFVADTSNSKEILYDILDTPVSPELLPPKEDGTINQTTEDNIGPYILHDFFLYHFLRYGASPKKLYYLAINTFKEEFSNEVILKWLKVFIKRFFTQQFKRNCIPDGIKVGSISLSPRGDLRMPSDASYNIWLSDLEDISL